jgi:diacylglycerol O-acyltransferase
MTRLIPPLDLAFLWIDRPETPANVGVIMLFEPARGSTAASAARQVIRAYRSAHPAPPFDCVPDLVSLGLPHWRTAGDIDLRDHVRHEHLPAPGSLEQLCSHVARLHEEPLPRSRPLFRVHAIDGLESGQLAIYLKSHHASWDGRYALQRVFGNLAPEPGPVQPPFFAAHGNPAPEDGHRASLADMATGVRGLVSQFAGIRELVTRLAAQTRADRGRGELRGNRPFAGPHTRFNDPVGPRRSYSCFSLPLDEMRRIARGCGGTLNDVALAVVDAGVERYLAALGERPRQPLVAMCPVSLRESGDMEATTKAATLFVPLATPRAGSERRLQEIVANTRAAKDEFNALSREAALEYAVLAFGLWFASSTLGLGAVTRPVINLVVSNVGAIDGPRYLGKHRLVAAYPVSMLADPAGLNVTVMSLGDQMDFGLIANATAVPDAGKLATSCLEAFQGLARRARRASPAGSASTRARRRRGTRRVSP